jgi:chemotaxis protein methyltransferase CheR
MRADIDEPDVRRFLEAIHEAYGYDLRGYSASSIRRRVLAALARSGRADLDDLQAAVLTDEHVFADVLDDLTVRVSEFFRDASFFRAFRERIVPVLRTYPTFKIWHAGCAAGEEVWSTAIVIDEEGLGARARIHATDLNARAIERAKQAIYAPGPNASFDAAYAAAGGRRDPAAYTTVAYSRLAIHERLKKNVVFFQHDLVNDGIFGEMEMVLCRNVLIYFGPELRRRVLARLATSVAPGGFLCLGSAERLGDGDWNGSRSFIAYEGCPGIYRRQV